MKTKNKKGFTLIEAIIVIFIIGLLSFIGAIGFGKVNRQKKVQRASDRINTEVGNNRDYSLFGRETNNKYPCGYGVAIRKDQQEIKEFYTSGADLDRGGALASNKTCDELIENKNIELGVSSGIDPARTSLDGVNVQAIDQIIGSKVSQEASCFMIMFSAPRGKSYYSLSNSGSCPPTNAVFEPFSEVGSLNSNFFLATLIYREGSNTALSCLNLYPSGNTTLDSNEERPDNTCGPLP